MHSILLLFLLYVCVCLYSNSTRVYGRYAQRVKSKILCMLLLLLYNRVGFGYKNNNIKPFLYNIM